MSLAKHLESQQLAVLQLVVLLEQERRALAQGRVDRENLSELTKHKQVVLQRLEQLEIVRATAQSKLGYGPGRQGALKAAQDADCVAIWKQLQASAQRAKDLNAANGGALSQRITYNQRILSFLNGVIGSRLYGPDGRAQRSNL
ncbi:MAG TPA: flagellar protein FlgN [Pseudomonas sp.]|jgi:flagella synthesis protein FlgN|uniref:flagella synthesis protein FlgN n=1 Tax=Pseudomonas sp. TaxID=306 RepID=UPI002ED965EE